MRRSELAAAALGALIASTAWGQAAAPTEFPAGAQPAADAALKEHLAGKVFHVERADGNHWRLQYQGHGFYYINTARGYTDSGKWRVEDSKLCSEPQKTAAACNDVRLADGALYLKRGNGEVIKLEPR
jgi:hypothetical protein